MDGVRQGKEMRWDTERQREKMKIYGSMCTHTHRPYALPCYSIANWSRLDLLENNDEIIFRMTIKRSDVSPVFFFFPFYLFYSNNLAVLHVYRST